MLSDYIADLHRAIQAYSRLSLNGIRIPDRLIDPIPITHK